MRSTGNPRLDAVIREALSGGEAAKYIERTLTIGGEDYTNRVKDGGYTTEDGPALVLDVDVAGFPEDLEGEMASLTIYVKGIGLEKFYGPILKPRQNGLLTVLKGATPGFFAENTELGSFQAYTGVNPSTVFYDGLTRLDYRQGLVNIETVEKPKFFRQDSGSNTGFNSVDSVKDLTDAVLSEVPLAWYDTGDGGSEVFVPPRLDHELAPVWTFEVGKDVELEDVSIAEEADYYRYVQVVRQKQNVLPGEDSVERIGEPVEIPNSKAPVGTVKHIELSDTASNMDWYTEAYDEAARIGYGKGRIDFTAQYIHPLLERGDPIALIVPGAEDKYRKTYLIVMDRESGTWNKKGTYGGESRVLEVVRPKRTPEALGGGSEGLVHPLNGYDALGAGYYDESLSFVSVGPEGETVFDDTQTEVSIDAEGATVISVPAGVTAGVTASDTRTIGELGDYTIGELN